MPDHGQWVRLLEGEPGAGPLRVLSIGSPAAPLARALRSRGHEVVELPPEGAEEALAGLARSSPGTLDAVLAVGFVERLRWDRWGLQQIHRMLREGGRLLLAVPDLYSLASLISPRYVASKLAKALGRPTAPHEIRSYSARRLRAILERIGYEPLRSSGHGLRPAWGLGDDGRWPPTHHVVLARRRPAAAALDVGDATRRFEAENREFLALRDRWRHQHGIPDAVPRPLEVERFAGARVLVLAPHPDDEIIGCGGTLLRLVRAGAKVTVLQATDGSASAALEDAPPADRRTIRLEEAHAVAEAASFEPTIFWNEDNHAFRAREELVARLRETLREIGPALVFTPWLADIHPDHLTLNRILAAALEGLPGKDTQVLGYEVWSLAPANLWCDVSSCMADVERLLLLYETAMKVDDFIHMCRTRNRYHARAMAGAPGYAEAFFATDPSRFREMVGRAPGAATSRSAP